MPIFFSDHKRKEFSPIAFSDHPEFTPDLTPRQIFQLGSFGGTYWRPIHSAITGRNYSSEHKKFDFLSDLPDSIMVRPWSSYDKSINRYKVKVGTTLEYWESKGWITKYDPYGWVQWYCNFYNGRRTPDDARQIKRWLAIKKRFTRKSPAVQQTLQHWGVSM